MRPRVRRPQATPTAPAGAEAEKAHSVHIGRQPVYHDSGELFGYELLFRSHAGATAADLSELDGDAATSSTIMRAFAEFDTQALLGGRIGLINLTRAFLVGELPIPFGPEQVFLEVLETVQVDDEVLAGIRRLREQGYRLALDDVVWSQKLPELLPHVDLVKIDITVMSWDDVLALRDLCAEHGVRVLAERVEDAADLRKCLEAGFELFQGYHLGRPETLAAKSLSPQQALALELIARLADPEISVDEVEQLVRRDPGLTLRLLRIVNSAGFGLERTLDSIRDAVVFLGISAVRAWTMLLSVGGQVSHPQLLSEALVMARTCEGVARRTDLHPADAFTVGMLLGIADSLDIELEELLDGLPPLADGLASPLRGDPGPLTTMVGAVTAYIRDDDEAFERAGVSGSIVAAAYLEAMAWSHTMVSAADGASDSAADSKKVGQSAGV